MRFLVIGGAGYIGSHFVWEALRQGHSCVVYDNLKRGHRASVPREVNLIEADILNTRLLQTTLEDDSFDAILHFAALALVGESVSEPNLYYQNNVEGLRGLLEAMQLSKTKASLVFSSTCAIFGTPRKLPILEDDIKDPISPYGRSKLCAEWLIEDNCHAYGLKAMALRYFNACGADPSGSIGEAHEPETHLIPNVIHSALAGQKLTIFGSDFPTRDGTCVRDYIHVTDLADAHIRAAVYLAKANPRTFETANLGTGQGSTNLEVVQAVERALGRKVAYSFGARRSGDPAELFADNSKAKKIIGFVTRYSSLDSVINTALRWHQNHAQGFG